MPENIYGSDGMNVSPDSPGSPDSNDSRGSHESRGALPVPGDPFDRPESAAGTGFEASGKRLLPGWAIKLLLFCLLGLSALGIARCHNRDEGYARVADISPSGKSAQRLSPDASPAYKEQLAVYSERKAEEARKKEDSFVAPAIGGTLRARDQQGPVLTARPKAEKKPDPPAESRPVLREGAPPAKERAAAEPVKRKSGPEDDGQQKKRMLQYLGALRQQKVPARGATLVLGRPSDAASSAIAKDAGKEDVAVSATGLPGIHVGDILLAVNRVTLDSDAPGPAMCEIVLGPYKGARAVGSFVRHGEHLVLSFTELVTKNGESLSIQGCAIDPETDRTAVRSSVDTHALERFGGLIAASFLEGFGDATRRSGTSSYSSIYGSGYSTPRYSLSDEAWIAGGKVGERLGRQMEKNFERAPTVVLKSGTGMGILILRTAQRTEQGGQRQEEKAKAGIVVR